MARSINHVKQVQKPAGISAARWIAWRVLLRVFDQQAYVGEALAVETDKLDASSRDIRQAQRLSHGAIQSAKLIDYVIAEVGKRPLKKIDTPLLNAVRLGLYELMYLDSADHGAVNECVEIVRATLGERPVAFANAVLRRGQARYMEILEPLSALVADPDTAETELLATWLSYPEWIVDLLRDTWGTEGVTFLAAQNPDTAPVESPSWQQQLPNLHERVGIRINTLLAPSDLQEQVAGMALDLAVADDVGATGWVVPRSRLSELADHIDDKQLIRQSIASQLAVAHLDPHPGERVLDMCSAPGGKAMDIAARLDNTGELICLEKHPKRARQLAGSLAQVGVTNHTVHTGAAQEYPVSEGPFDRVLVDAPCSGFGVMTHRPDLRFNRTRESLDSLPRMQHELLSHALRLAAPGGRVVYATCTVLPAENADVVQKATAGTAWQVTTERTLMPNADGCDGFYIATIEQEPGA